jgi:hypothetical protein
MKAARPGTWLALPPAALVLMAALVRAPGTPPAGVGPLLGLAIEFEKPPAADVERRALEEVRRTGVNFFVLSLSWSEAEPAPRKFRLEKVTRTARILRQSGATLHLDLPLVSGRRRDVPADLARFAFDDPKLSVRLGQLFDALGPALADFATISLGYEADAYFADKPTELAAFRRLFDGAVTFLRKVAPHLGVGVTTSAPGQSVAPEVAAELHRNSPILFYLYAPFAPGKPYWHSPAEALEADWKRLLESARGRPIAFPEVSYSSSTENGSSPQMQAEFVRRLRRFVSATDGRRLLFARYVGWRDAPPRMYEGGAGAADVVRRKMSFFANRGLKEADGKAKPAWREWVRGAK